MTLEPHPPQLHHTPWSQGGSRSAHLRVAIVQAISTVLWADGAVDSAELAAMSSAAHVLGFERGDPREAALASAVSLNDVRVSGLDADERRTVFVAAAWMAAVDGLVHGAELQLLRRLAKKLGLDGASARQLHDFALRLRSAAAPREPSHGEFEALLRGASHLHNAA